VDVHRTRYAYEPAPREYRGPVVAGQAEPQFFASAGSISAAGFNSDEVVRVGDWVAVTRDGGDLLSEGSVFKVRRENGETWVSWQHSVHGSDSTTFTSPVPPLPGLTMTVTRGSDSWIAYTKPPPTETEAMVGELLAQADEPYSAREADNEKARRYLQRRDEQLQQDIKAAGEAGWDSMFYTGSPGFLPGNPQEYRHWKEARDAYVCSTASAEHREQLLQAMLAYVDIDTCPPRPLPAPEPPRRSLGSRTWHGLACAIEQHPYLMAAVLLGFAVFCLCKAGVL
jgi:hypothetical protein